MEEIRGNILNIHKGIIAHQVNCQGVMGAGLARAIKMKWPVVYWEYGKKCRQLLHSPLGDCQVVRVDDGLFVANLFGQLDYGREGKHTSYEALETAFQYLAHDAKLYNAQVYIPYKIGCGLGGGSWPVVKMLICKYLPNATIVRRGHD